MRGRQSGFSKSQLHELIQTLGVDSEPFTKIALPSLQGLEFITIEHIIRCEADNNYCTVHLTGGNKLLVSRPLKYLEELLKAHRFYRTHQSHLVNLNHINRYVRTDGGYLVMSDNSVVGISRNRKDGFLALLGG